MCSLLDKDAVEIPQNRSGGITVNPRREELAGRLRRASLPVVPIEDFRREAGEITGIPERPPFEGRIVAVVEYRDGTVMDVVRRV